MEIFRKSAAGITLVIVAALLLAGCTGTGTQENPPAPAISAAVVGCEDGSSASTGACALPEATANKVEVIHFHGTNQCYSCITVGDYAEATVKAYFADELASGRITFSHVNGELPENAQLVDKYGATGSSLWIGVYGESGFHKEQNINVWYKINNKKGYMDYLKGVLEKRLGGDLS